MKARAKEMISSNAFLKAICSPFLAMRRSLIRNLSYLGRFYTWYDIVFEDVIDGSVVVPVPDYRGTFEIGCHSDLLKRVVVTKSYEPECARCVTEYVDATRDAIDIGTNVGFYSVLIRQLLSQDARLLAVEPTPNAYRLLERNLRRNNCWDGVILCNGAVSDVEGTVSIHFIEGREEYSSIGKVTDDRPGSQTALEVPSRTLDSLVAEHALNPGFIKMDAEGAEYLILQGGIDTLKTFKPVILSEIADVFLANFGHDSQSVFEVLRGLGYTLINPRMPKTAVTSPYRGEVLAIPTQAGR